MAATPAPSIAHDNPVSRPTATVTLVTVQIVLTGELDQQPAGFQQVIHELTRRYGTPEIPHITYVYQTGVDQPVRTVTTMYLRVRGAGGFGLKRLLARLGHYTDEVHTLTHTHPVSQSDPAPADGKGGSRMRTRPPQADHATPQDDLGRRDLGTVLGQIVGRQLGQRAAAARLPRPKPLDPED